MIGKVLLVGTVWYYTGPKQEYIPITLQENVMATKKKSATPKRGKEVAKAVKKKPTLGKAARGFKQAKPAVKKTPDTMPAQDRPQPGQEPMVDQSGVHFEP